MNTWSAFVLAGLSACALAKPYYVKGEFDAGSGDIREIYYPVDICVRQAVASNFAKFTCLSVDSYREDMYDSCSTGCDCTPLTTTYTVDDDVDFNCKGNSTHDYMTTDTRLGSCAGNPMFTVFSVVGHCFEIANSTQTISNCDAHSTTLDLYMGGDDCTQDTFINSTTVATDECELFMEVGFVKIYTEMSKCVLDGEEVEDDDDGSAVMSAMLAMVSALTALLFL